MKNVTLILSICCLSLSARGQSLQTFHDFQGIGILGDTIDFSDYANKKVLVVNTASFCSYTPQFADLVTLDSLYSGPGFAIVGFPCNDFGGQDPGDDSTIFGFCTNVYNVAFQMMSKISITAPDTAEVYKWLQLQSLNGVANASVTWNFHKFCIDELGHWVMHFPSTVNPLDTAITNWINAPSATGVSQSTSAEEFYLSENPARDAVTVNLLITQPQNIYLELIDMRGLPVSNHRTGTFSGKRVVSFPAENLSPGVYVIRISSPGGVRQLKALLIK